MDPDLWIGNAKIRKKVSFLFFFSSSPFFFLFIVSTDSSKTKTTWDASDNLDKTVSSHRCCLFLEDRYRDEVSRLVSDHCGLHPGEDRETVWKDLSSAMYEVSYCRAKELLAAIDRNNNNNNNKLNKLRAISRVLKPCWVLCGSVLNQMFADDKDDKDGYMTVTVLKRELDNLFLMSN